MKRGDEMVRVWFGWITLILVLVTVACLSVSHAQFVQPVSPPPDYSVTVTAAVTPVIPLGFGSRSRIEMQNQGTAAVACRPDGIPSFSGNSYVLRGGTAVAGQPTVGDRLSLFDKEADIRAWSCIAFSGSSPLMVKVYP